MSQDLFDMFSSPQTTSQPNSQTLQFNMAIPSVGMAGQNQSGSSNLFGGMTSSGSSGALSDLAGLHTSSPNQPPFGIMNQQPISAFGQMSINSDINTNMTANQPSSMFGQPLHQQTPSPFGQMGVGQHSQPPPCMFGQTGTVNHQTTQQTPLQFNPLNPGQSVQQQYGQIPVGQNTQQQMATFGGFPTSAQNQMGVNSFPIGGTTENNATNQFGGLAAFSQASTPASTPNTMTQQSHPDPFAAFGSLSQPSNTSLSPNMSQQPTAQIDAFASFASLSQTPTPTPVTSPMPQQAGSDPFSGFGAFGQSSNQAMAINSPTQKLNSDPFSNIPNSKQTNDDDFFAAFSTSSNMAPSAGESNHQTTSSVVDDSFMNAFSQSASINTNKTTSSSNQTGFEAFQDHSDPFSSSQGTGTHDSFDPFGLSSPKQTQQQQSTMEPLFEAFNTPEVEVTSPMSETIESQPDDTVDVVDDNSTEVESSERQTDEKASNKGSKSTSQSSKEAKKEAPIELTDPVLREIHEKFGGKWKLVRSEPYDEFLKSVGIGLVHRKRAGKGSPDQVLEVKPSGHIHVTIKSALHSQAYIFKLNEETQNLVEKVAQNVFCSYSQGKLFLQMTPADDSFGKTQEVERFINDLGEQVVIYSAGIASCRRYFARSDQSSKVASTPTTETKTTESQPQAKTAPNQSSSPTETQPQSPQPISITVQQPPIKVEPIQKPTLLVLSDPIKNSSALTSSANTKKVAIDIKLPPPTSPSSPNKSVTTPVTPGQLLLQNLQGGDAEDNSQTATEAEEVPFDNGARIFFHQDNGEDEESEA